MLWTILFATFIYCCPSVFAEDYSISITTSGTVNLTSNASGTAIESSNINVATTCRSGYDLTLATSTHNNNLYLNGDITNNAENSYLTPSDGTTTLINAPNTWGYLSSPTTPNTNSVFLPVSSDPLHPSIIKTANETASNQDIDDSFAVYYAAHADSSLISGTYKMIPEDSSASPIENGGLTYYLTASPNCNANLDITFNKNLDGEGGETGDTVENFPDSTENIKDLVNYTYTLSNKTPTRSGYTFKEWNTEADGTGNYYRPGQVIPIGTDGLTGSVTLYAIWVADCPSGNICYDGNHADAGIVPNQEAANGSNTRLTSSNFSRAGYGFAGWNTASDGTGTQYGPQQNITMPSTGGINLYATWIKESGTFQAWHGASTISTGEVVALRDVRDDEVYTVAKLADGNIWMVENLRLVPGTASLSAINTNNPTQSFLQNVPNTSSSVNQCSSDDSSCIDQIFYYTNNMDRSLNQSPTGNTSANAWYSYGVMYNWYTATAGHGTYDFDSTSGPNEDGTVAGDICPAGWHLPTGASAGEYNGLATILGGNGSAGANALRTYPNNFILSADYNPQKGIPDARGSQGRLWTSTVTTDNAKAYRMGYNASTVTPTGSWNKWDNFAVRCIYQGGNIPYVDVDIDFEGHGITSVTFYNETYGTITATPNHPVAQIVADIAYTVTANTNTGYELKNWSTTTNGTLSDATSNPTTYTVTDAVTLTVIGKTIPAFDVTVTLPANVTSISFTHPDFPAQTVETSGDVVSLKRGIAYTVTATFEDGYTINSWTAGPNSTLGSASSNPTTFTITDDTTLTLTTRESVLSTYTLHYDAGLGADAPVDEIETTYNDYYSFTISETIPFLFGYSFLGWSETSGASTATYVYDTASAAFTPSTITVTNPNPESTNISKTLYAVYQEDTCPSEQICYYGNGANSGVMSNQVASSNSETTLIPSNYAKTGYGFAGWLAAAASGNTPETIYGPNATITTPDLSSNGMKLYAKWVRSAGNMQTWGSCSSLNVNEVTALTDTRDNETYAIAKLADNQCWMIENMRLVPSTANITDTNTNGPATGFASAAANSSTSDVLCGVDDDTDCNDQLQYNTNNLNRSIPQSYNTAGRRIAWYSYGVYYNWFTATAGNGTIATGANEAVTGDLCPAGWHLPTGNNGEYVTMNAAVNNGSGDANLRAYPNNFLWSGDYNKNSRTNGGINGRYWTSTSFSSDSAYRFGFQPDKMAVNGNYKKWDAFTIRCIYSGNSENNTPETTNNEPAAMSPQTNPSNLSNLNDTNTNDNVDELNTVNTNDNTSSANSTDNADNTNNVDEAMQPALSTPTENNSTLEETEDLTENTHVSDSYTEPQGVSEYTAQPIEKNIEETTDNTATILASVAATATISAIGIFAFARHRNEDDHQ